jgi:hypothetical protein
LKDLEDLINRDFVEASPSTTTLRHGGHSVSGVPEKVRIAPAGAAQVRDAHEEKHRAGM